MNYGQIAGNKSINEMIYACFEVIAEEDQKKFLKKFRNLSPDSAEVMHVFRELILGTYLHTNGFDAKYDCSINGFSPDWCIPGKLSGFEAIFELTNFHIDRVTDNQIDAQLESRRISTYWRDGNRDNLRRLYDAICRKAQKYGALVEQLCIPYVVVIFGEFRAALEFYEDIYPCLVDESEGIFARFPNVSGILYFAESSGIYQFIFEDNPKGVYELGWPSGYPQENRGKLILPISNTK